MAITFPIVGIGASAGGLEAISELLGALPAEIGAALVVVQHLDRNQESFLSDILARKSKMPVDLAQHGLTPLVDHVYVIPPNTTLTLLADQLHLEPRDPGRQPHKPVDALFQSLAVECGPGAVAVVLSGADSDGARGIQDVKHAGGITFAQAPDTARVPSMPRSAIETGCVDLVLPPDRIAQELARLVTHPYVKLAPADDGAAEETPPPAAVTEPNLHGVFRRLRANHGVDFSRYKQSTLRRRLARRMALHRTNDLDEYLALLDSDSSEAAALYQDFLIRVTHFFRDPESFVALASVFPQLIAGHSQKEPIRIWVPGCATGEEVYSIAIVLLESLGDQASSIGIQIFGTDVSETAIEKARAGIYLDTIVNEVSPERLSRHFVKLDGHYSIARSVRDLCIFARHDVTRDPPFSRLDLVSCRNLLIYLDSGIQQRVMQLFHYALRKQGMLMLGPSESVGFASDLFELSDKTHRFYKPRWKGAGMNIDLQRPATQAAAPPDEAISPQPTTEYLEVDSVLRQADRWFLARYAPAGILVDDTLDILQYRGEVGPYLAPASGPPTLNLRRVVRPELLVEMIPALEQARETGAIARRPGLDVTGVGAVDMEVVCLPRSGAAPCFLFIFEDSARYSVGRQDRIAQSAQLSDNDKDLRNAHLERENADLREFLQATHEQHEAAREELKSAHEEVLSANEEFQSTNEELETSKEELQSGNEELTTTNEELRDRNRQLGVLNEELDKARQAAERAQAYADGIVETVREPLVVLNSELNVVRANRAFYVEFLQRPEDSVDRPLRDVCSWLWSAGSLGERLSRVLSHGESLLDLEVEHASADGKHRVLCVNARRIASDVARAALILLSIEDITESRARTDGLRAESRRKDEFLAMLAHELRNPLGPISHAALLLKRGNPEQASLCEMIERQTTRLVRLVDELLDVARINRGLIELRREPVDLVPILTNTIEAGRARLESRTQILTVSLPDHPVCVDGDVVRLEQVIANLFENAIKYTNPGGEIHIALEESLDEAVMIFSDNGIGLEPAALSRIFELFNQVDSSLARSGGGLGLGLTVVRRVLELHGGHIEAVSDGLGKGSRFTVRLPLLAVEQLHQGNSEHAATRPEPTVSRRVLVVDDNVDSADAVGMLARAWGHEVRIAHTANRALALCAEFSPHLALLDIGLPDMDGYALARQLRSLDVHGGLKLVAMTGYGRKEDRVASREAGFDAHIVKPADPDDLERMLAMA